MSAPRDGDYANSPDSVGFDADVVCVVTSQQGYPPSLANGKTAPPDEDDSALAALREIKPTGPTTRFIQAFDSLRRRLSFGCGDSEKGVVVRSDRTREVVPTGFRRTKLSPDVLTKYLRGDRSPSSRRLVERVTGTLEQHVYFEDPRLYTLVALWVIGTYLYSTFGHYGYLFLFSMLMRSGKTRVIEVLSHLAFEASAPLNAPTPASLRELASGGGTSLLDTLERWRDKNQESHSAAMDILDAGFRNGGVVTKMVTGLDPVS